MADEQVMAALTRTGVSRRAFLKYCATLSSLLALPGTTAAELVARLQAARRQPVIWLSCQECTGCTESLTRSAAPALENLLFDFISLDYHHTLMAAAGTAAESAREQTLKQSHGQFLLVVDGSVPARPGYSLPVTTIWRCSGTASRALQRSSQSAVAQSSAACRRQRPTRAAHWAWRR